jgi:uncharacterized membrane protein
MGRDQLRERAEHLLREPNNLFGPPTGQGYDYLRAGLIVAALALAALSGWCLLTAENVPMLAWLLLLAGVPFCIGVWLFWPFNLLLGWVGAAVVWYATLHTVACLAGLRHCGRAARVGWAVVATVGWAVGAWLAIALWR